jgi:hypothetical protein
MIRLIAPESLCTTYLLLENKQGLGLKTYSFKVKGVLELSIFSWVFQLLIVPKVDTEKLVRVSILFSSSDKLF